MTELLVEKVLSSLGAPLSPGDAVRRVFEAVASGILFSSKRNFVPLVKIEALSLKSRGNIVAKL